MCFNTVLKYLHKSQLQRRKMDACNKNLVKYRILVSYLLFTQKGHAFQSIPAYSISSKTGMQSRSFASFFKHEQIYTSSQLRLRYGEPHNRRDSSVILKDSSKNLFSKKRNGKLENVAVNTNDEKSKSNVMEDLVKYLRRDEEDVMEKIIIIDETDKSEEDSILLPIIGSVVTVAAVLLRCVLRYDDFSRVFDWIQSRCAVDIQLQKYYVADISVICNHPNAVRIQHSLMQSRLSLLILHWRFSN